MRYLIVVLSLVLLPLSALADTFTIEDGLIWTDGGTFSFNVSGENFRAQGGDTPTPLFASVRPGQILNATNRLFLAGGNYTFGDVTVTTSTPSHAGSTWELVAVANVPLNFAGETLQGPASVLANVRLDLPSAGPPPTVTTTQHTIQGSGQATFSFVNLGVPDNPSFALRRIDVNFGSPSPIGNTINGNGAVPTIPEPSTWLLLASGLGGLAWYRRTHGPRSELNAPVMAVIEKPLSAR